MNRFFIEDYERANRENFSLCRFIIRYFKHHYIRFLFWGRLNSNSSIKMIKIISRIMQNSYKNKYGLEINFENVGGGIRLIHPWCITVNSNAILGNNVTLYKGCTIGEITTGNKRGNPIIEDNVTVYANATICGGIRVGQNSEIAAGSFVNFDVPSNSVVIGNPGVIHCRI